MIHPLTLLTLKTTNHNVSQIQIKLSHTFRFLKALKDSRVHALVIINRKEEKRKKSSHTIDDTQHFDDDHVSETFCEFYFGFNSQRLCCC